MKSKKVLLPILVFVIFVYWGWHSLTSPWGSQKVSFAPSKQECYSSASSALKYCVHSAPQGVNGDVAYHFHGRNLDEQIWNDDTYYTALIQKHWADQGLKPPTVVTVSFGGVWLLTPKNGQTASGLLDTFTDEAIPEIEARIGKPKRRLVFGESMGGLNALFAALIRPQLFSKAAALCPGVYLGTPFASWSDIKAFLTRTGADPKIIFGVRTLAKRYVATDKE